MSTAFPKSQNYSLWESVYTPSPFPFLDPDIECGKVSQQSFHLEIMFRISNEQKTKCETLSVTNNSFLNIERNSS